MTPTPRDRQALIELIASQLIVLLVPREDDEDADKCNYDEILQNCRSYAGIILRNLESANLRIVPEVPTEEMLFNLSSPTPSSDYTYMLAASPYSKGQAK